MRATGLIVVPPAIEISVMNDNCTWANINTLSDMNLSYMSASVCQSGFQWDPINRKNR